jgi:hypothetical protein
MVEEVNGGDNLIDLEDIYRLNQKGHPHPWKDGTWPGMPNITLMEA